MAPSPLWGGLGRGATVRGSVAPLPNPPHRGEGKDFRNAGCCHPGQSCKLRSIPDSRCRDAFTLIEVVLALAILAGALAILGEIMSSADRSASDAQAETRAQQLASSLMDKILCGAIESTDQARAPMEVEDSVPWVYSVTISPTTIQGISSIELLVEQDLEQKFDPVKFRLVRWVGPADESAEDSSSEQDSDSSSSSTGGSDA